MRSGIYRIEVSWPNVNDCGVGIIKGEAFRGVDRDSAYIGECSEKDGVPMLSLRRVPLAEAIDDANFSLAVTVFGQADHQGFSLTCETDPIPITIHGKWIAEA